MNSSMKMLFVGCAMCVQCMVRVKQNSALYCHYYLKVEGKKSRRCSIYLVSLLFFISFTVVKAGSARNSVAQNGFYLIFYAL